jgi:hypothetical protein
MAGSVVVALKLRLISWPVAGSICGEGTALGAQPVRVTLRLSDTSGGGAGDDPTGAAPPVSLGALVPPKI